MRKIKDQIQSLHELSLYNLFLYTFIFNGLFNLSIAQQSKLELTLDGCVKMALESSFQIQNAKHAHQVEYYKWQELRRTYFPKWANAFSFEQSSSPSLLNTDVGSGAEIITYKNQNISTAVQWLSPLGSDLNVTFSNDKIATTSANALISPYYQSKLEFGIKQPLLGSLIWDNGIWSRNYLELTGLKHMKNAYAHLEKETTAKQILDIETKYYELFALNQTLEARRSALELTQRQHDFVEQKIKAGLSVQTELIQIQERLSFRNLELLKAKQLYDEKKRELVVAMGLKTDHDLLNTDWILSIPKTIKWYEYNMTNLERDLDANNQALLSQKELVRNRQLLSKISKHERLPKLDIEGSYYMLGGNTQNSTGLSSDLNELFDSRSDGFEFMANFELPMGPNPKGSRYRIIKLQSEIERNNFNQLKRQIYHEVRQLLQRARYGKDLILLSQKTLELAKKKLEFEEKKYEAGLTTSFTVLTYQADLTTAQVDSVNALVDYLITTSLLDYYLGKNFIKHGISQS